MRKPRSIVVVISFLLIVSSAAVAQNQTSAAETRPYQITFQPKATYTDEARANNVQGKVRLRIALLASGEVGTITVVKTKGWQRMKKHGLTQRAIRAAREIRFTPKLVNGVPISVVVNREYTFTIY